MQLRLPFFLILTVVGQGAHAEDAERCYCPQGLRPERVEIVEDGTRREYDLESKSRQAGYEWLQVLYWQDPDIQRLVSIRPLEVYREPLIELSKLPSEEQCKIADVASLNWNPDSDPFPDPQHPCP